MFQVNIKDFNGIDELFNQKQLEKNWDLLRAKYKLKDLQELKDKMMKPNCGKAMEYLLLEGGEFMPKFGEWYEIWGRQAQLGGLKDMQYDGSIADWIMGVFQAIGRKT